MWIGLNNLKQVCKYSTCCWFTPINASMTAENFLRTCHDETHTADECVLNHAAAPGAVTEAACVSPSVVQIPLVIILLSSSPCHCIQYVITNYVYYYVNE